MDEDVSIHPRCQINEFVANIEIGRGVMIGPSCAFYSYNHGILPDRLIRDQPLESKGGIIIGEEVWVGVHVTVLSGVRVGRGAVLAARAVVMRAFRTGPLRRQPAAGAEVAERTDETHSIDRPSRPRTGVCPPTPSVGLTRRLPGQSRRRGCEYGLWHHAMTCLPTR